MNEALPARTRLPARQSPIWLVGRLCRSAEASRERGPAFELNHDAAQHELRLERN
jgi:hypothetical protein